MKTIYGGAALVLILIAVVFFVARQIYPTVEKEPTQLEQVRSALNASTVGKEISFVNDTSSTITIDEQIGEYMKVGIHTNPGGYGALLKKETVGYRVIFFSQEAPSCEALDKENLPPLVQQHLVIGGGGCYEADGSTYRE